MKTENKRLLVLLIETEKRFQSELLAQIDPKIECQVVRKSLLNHQLRLMANITIPIIVLISIKNDNDEKWAANLMSNQLQIFPKLKFFLVLEKSNLKLIQQCLKFGNSSLVLHSELENNAVKYFEQLLTTQLVLSPILMKALFENLKQPINELLKIKALTPREGQVLNLIAKGFLNKEIKNQLNISENTVKSLTYKIYKKLQVKNRIAAVRKYYNV